MAAALPPIQTLVELARAHDAPMQELLECSALELMELMEETVGGVGVLARRRIAAEHVKLGSAQRQQQQRQGGAEREATDGAPSEGVPARRANLGRWEPPPHPAGAQSSWRRNLYVPPSASSVCMLIRSLA